MTNYQIEQMTAQHLRGVHNVESSCFAIPWSLDLFEAELANPAAIYIVAAAGQEIIGFAGMHHVLDEGHVTNIAVLADYRKQGIGDALLCALIDISKQLGIAAITLEVRMGNAAAQRLYGRHGFGFSGIRKNYYFDTKEDAIIMWKYFDKEGAVTL